MANTCEWVELMIKAKIHAESTVWNSRGALQRTGASTLLRGKCGNKQSQSLLQDTFPELIYTVTRVTTADPIKQNGALTFSTTCLAYDPHEPG